MRFFAGHGEGNPSPAKREHLKHVKPLTASSARLTVRTGDAER